MSGQEGGAQAEKAESNKKKTVVATHGWPLPAGGSLRNQVVWGIDVAPMVAH
ncbi:hypothetical protein GYB59_02440 [bacterium]|nr:hypothetical protein [bacterium]